ncbi:MAG: hypothetical protein SO101_14330 [Lachnospiraceae bacterium]|nr:hypothetical protein [Lachnospiraceae bacterium]
MDKKKDNIFVNIIIFIVIILVFYYAVVMPEDLPVHTQMACGALSELFGNLAK